MENGRKKDEYAKIRKISRSGKPSKSSFALTNTNARSHDLKVFPIDKSGDVGLQGSSPTSHDLWMGN